MATRFSSDVHIAAPPGRVYEALLDFDAAPRWKPGLVSIEPLQGDGGPGTEFRETREMMGRQGSQVFEVTEAAPGRSLRLRADGRRGTVGSGEHRIDFSLEPEDGGTRLTIDGLVELPGGMMARLMAPMIEGAIRKAMEGDLAALKAYLEDGESGGA